MESDLAQAVEVRHPGPDGLLLAALLRWSASRPVVDAETAHAVARLARTLEQRLSKGGNSEESATTRKPLC